MKHLHVINFVLFTACAFGSDVRVGTNKVALAFEDGALSLIDKVVIAEDIQHVLSTATVGEIALTPYENKKKRHQGIKGRISVGPKGHHWPRAFWENDFGDYRIDETTSQKKLIVPEKMVDAYRKAIEFKNNHPDEFASLDVFLKHLNIGFQPEKMTFDEKKALFWFPPGSPSWAEESYYDKNLLEMKTISFRHPSLLSFQETQIEDRTVIYCRLIIELKKDGSLHQVVLVYDGTGWRIGPS